MNNYYVINKNNFEMQVIDKEAIFQNKSNGTVHFLNEAAFIIYEMKCKGNSMENIVKEFAEKFPDVDAKLIEADCKTTIEDFIKNDIISIEAE